MFALRKFIPRVHLLHRWNSTEGIPHLPVMADEVIQALNPQSGKTYIDMTFGAGGHTRRILEAAKDIKVIAIDRDPDALYYATKLADEFPGQLIPLLGRFSDVLGLMNSIEMPERSVDGILFDFGCSSMQFDRGDRGFSINNNGPLDMRMDKRRDPSQPTAADVLAKVSEEDLSKIIKIYGEEKKAKKIAHEIIEFRHSCKRIETTHELARIVASCFNESHHLDPLTRPMHNATKTFQAIRIFVNNELNEINYGMYAAEKLLKPNGRLVTLTFHSLEDTIVKRHIAGNVVDGLVSGVPLQFFSHLTNKNTEIVESVHESAWHPIYKHVLLPTPAEVHLNSRSRSAKMRAALKNPIANADTIDAKRHKEIC